MANTTTGAKDQKVLALNLHRLLALRTDNDIGLGPSMHLDSWFRDGPKSYFTTTSGSPKTSTVTDPHSLKQDTDSMYLSRERTDSEKAVQGSDDEPLSNGRVGFQHIAGHIPSENSEELYQRGIEAKAIINGIDRAFNGHFGSHFDMDSNDLGLWPLAASNQEEARAMVEGLERAHGN